MTLLLALIDYDTSSWLIAGNMFVRGLFMAFIFVPMQAVSFATISPGSMGRASSILSVTRTDVYVSFACGVVILLVIAFLFRPLLFASIDPEVAEVFDTPESVNAILRAVVAALPKGSKRKAKDK